MHNIIKYLCLISMKSFTLIFPLLVDTSAAFSLKSKVVPLKGISATQFRHPLDKTLTDAIQNTPLANLAEGAIRSTFSLVEQGVRLDLLSSSVRVSQDQLPELHDAMQSAAQVLDMKRVPDLFIQSSSQANAYTLALESKSGSPPIVVITSALIERCSNEEVQAIIGHELGHLKCSHSLYLTLGGLVSSPFRNLPIVGSQTEKLLQDWRLSAEYSCDRAALLVAQDVNVVAGAMLKLFAGTNKVSNTKAFLEQAKEYEKLLKDVNPLVRMSVSMQTRTHPLPVKRVAELEKWFGSKEYNALLGIQDT